MATEVRHRSPNASHKAHLKSTAGHEGIGDRIEEAIVDEAVLSIQPDDEDTDSPNDDSSIDDIARMNCFSLLGAVANLCSATLGAGILALPFGFYQSGILAGGLLLIMAALSTLTSIRLLVQAAHHFDCHGGSYEDLVERALGARMRRVAEITILIFCQGTCIAYMVVVGDILELLVGHAHRVTSMTLVFLVLLLPLSLLRTMESLQYASSLGVTSISILVLSAIHHYLYSHHEATGNDDDDFPTTTHSLLFPAGAGTLLGVIRSILQASPIVLFAFSCQVNVLPIYSELPSNNTSNKHADMSRIAVLAALICSTFYTSISVTALLDFGSAINPNVLLNYYHHDDQHHARVALLTQVAIAGMAMAIVAAFPLNVFPARVTLNGLLPRSKKNESSTTVEEDGGETLQEPLLQPSEAETDGNPTVLQGDQHVADENGCCIDESLLTATVTQADYRSPQGNESWSRHVWLTMAIAWSAFFLALIVPNISVVFGLLGGTTTSILGFVLPGWLGIVMGVDDEDKRTSRLLGWVLVVIGCLVGVLTTGVTVYSTFF